MYTAKPHIFDDVTRSVTKAMIAYASPCAFRLKRSENSTYCCFKKCAECEKTMTFDVNSIAVDTN